MPGNTLNPKKAGSNNTGIQFDTILQRLASLETKVDNFHEDLSDLKNRVDCLSKKIDELLYEKIAEMDLRLTKLEAMGKFLKNAIFIASLGVSAVLGILKLLEVIK